MSLVARLSTLIDRLVPPAIRTGDPEPLRRARLLLWFWAISLPMIPSFAVIYLLLGLGRAAAFMFMAGAFSVTMPLVLRRSLPSAVIYQVLSGLLLLDGVVWYTGGIRAPGLPFTTVMPVVALLCSNRRLGLASFGVIAANSVLLAVLSGRHPGPQDLLAAWAPQFGAFGILLLGMTTLGGAVAYDVTKERMRAELDAANRDLRLVLDNVDQGLLTLDLEGRICRERSAIADRWLDHPVEGTLLSAQLGRLVPAAGEQFEVGWDGLRENPALAELLLDQLPARLTVDGRVLRLSYLPIMSGDALHKVLVVLSDITSEVERERAEAEQRDLAALVARFVASRATLLEFIDSGNALVRRVTERPAAGLDDADLRRSLHTLKGNAGSFSLHGLAALCHRLEERLGVGEGALRAEDREELRTRWRRLTEIVDQIDGQVARQIEIPAAEHEAVVAGILDGAPRAELARIVEGWRLQPLEDRLQHCADQVRSLGQRLGRGPIDVRVSARGLRLSAEHWADFFAAFTHALRNTVDHGVEPAEERRAAGKPEAATVTLRAQLSGPEFILVLEDDGRGIDWDRVRARARARRLPCERPEELVAALFEDGISTRERVTEISGRGVGLGAVRAACAAIGGHVLIESQAGQGTRMTFVFPVAALAGPGRPRGPARPSRSPAGGAALRS